MADETQKPPEGATPGEEMVQIPRAELTKVLETIAASDKKEADWEAKFAGLEAMIADSKGGEAVGGLRERKSYEPKFRTVKLRKYPMAGNLDNLGIVVGWTDRGAYQQVDRTGVSPQTVDMIDIIFLGHERNETGKLQAEQVKLLDLLNAETVVCKILDMKKETRTEPTGEEIDVTTWDPQHGLITTGDKIDGYVAYSDITYRLQVPAVAEPVEIDATFVN